MKNKIMKIIINKNTKNLWKENEDLKNELKKKEIISDNLTTQMNQLEMKFSKEYMEKKQELLEKGFI